MLTTSIFPSMNTEMGGDRTEDCKRAHLDPFGCHVTNQCSCFTSAAAAVVINYLVNHCKWRFDVVIPVLLGDFYGRVIESKDRLVETWKMASTRSITDVLYAPCPRAPYGRPVVDSLCRRISCLGSARHPSSPPLHRDRFNSSDIRGPKRYFLEL